MDLFNLPESTKVNRIIPKNAFDKSTNTKEKKAFADIIEKIRWLNKLSLETVNLPSKEIQEIQVFEIILKLKEDIDGLVKIIDKAIPYPIVFLIRYADEISISASQKHSNPLNKDNTTVDWVFKSPWQKNEDIHFKLNLRQSLDFVFTDFCKQLSGREIEHISIIDLVAKERKLKELNRKVVNLKNALKRSKQFNQKLALNKELKVVEQELKSID